MDANDRWRIDDLAHETGLTVDTIRYYQREGLLPPAAREGRHRIYGPEHVRRLDRIKELQGRRFSIAAIRALVSGDEHRLEGIFADEGESFRYTFAELVERSGASPELARVLQEAGVLRDPHEFGRIAYDGDDLDMMRAMAALEHAEIPAKAIREIGRVYADGIEATQRRIVETFGTGGEIDWDEGELERFRSAAAAHAAVLLPSMRRLVDYTHHRTMQRLTLDSVARSANPNPGVDPDATEELTVAPPDGQD